MMERRRLHINGSIKELEKLLPRHIAMKVHQNKGSILKASAKYIRKLKKEQERFEKLEATIKQNELNNDRLMSRLQNLELMVKKTTCFKSALPDDLTQTNENKEDASQDPVSLKSNLNFHRKTQGPIVCSGHGTEMNDIIDDGS